MTEKYIHNIDITLVRSKMDSGLTTLHIIITKV